MPVNDPGGEDEGYELRHYVRAVRRRWPYVVATMVVFAALGFLLAPSGGKTAASTARILVTPTEAGQSSTRGAGGASGTAIGDEIAIMSSDQMRNAIEREAGHELETSIVQESPASNVVAITVMGSSETVKQDAQLYAETYRDRRRARLAAANEVAIEQLTARSAEVTAALDALAPQIADLDAQIAAAPDDNTLRSLENQREALITQQQSLTNRKASIQEELDRTTLAGLVNPTYGLEILSDASDPVTTGGGQKRRLANAGLALGLVAGILLALARDHFDRSIRSRHDLAQAAPGLSLLGVVGRQPGWSGKLLGDSRAPARREAYRRLRTSLELLKSDNNVHLVASAGADGAGATAVTTNLSDAFIAAQRSVVLIDANLRKPGLHVAFGLPNDRGLTSVLAGELSLEEALVEVPGRPGLRVLTTGPVVGDDSSALLSTMAAGELFWDVKAKAHLVLVDGPPVLALADSTVLATLVEDVILVVGAGTTTAPELPAALELLDRTAAPVVGAVLVGVEPGESDVGVYGDGRRAVLSKLAALPQLVSLPKLPKPPNIAKPVAPSLPSAEPSSSASNGNGNGNGADANGAPSGLSEVPR